MARIQKGGVFTQEVSKKAISLMAVFLMASAGVCMFLSSSDELDASYVVDIPEGEASYAKIGASYTFKVCNNTQNTVYCTCNLYNTSGTSQTTKNVEVGVNSSTSVEITLPSTAGSYKFVVKYYSDSDKSDDHFICERERWVKAVEPVTLTVTFENKNPTAITMRMAIVINGVEQTDSEKTVTISAAQDGKNGTGTYTYDYVTDNLNRSTSYKVISKESGIETKDIINLDKEFYFYTQQNDYKVITWFMVIVLIILIIILIWVYRKPVKNFGKPKARR